jgi:hypothetical protein
MQVAESQGPLVVKLRGDVVRLYRWYHHPEVSKGRLYVLDVLHGGRVAGEHAPGAWDEVIHDVGKAGLY